MRARRIVLAETLPYNDCMQEDRPLSERLWLGGSFFFFLALACGWIYFWGLLSGGMWPAPLLFVFLILVPFPFVAISVALLKGAQLMRRAHWVTLTLFAIAVIPLYKQPWNPRNVFISKLTSLTPGMTEQEVRRRMEGYLGGTKSKLDNSEFGATHCMYYRWNDEDGRFNADVGFVYLNGDRVVSTDFSPD